ncbi:sulfatase family protein [Blastopirellula marina]|uniref:Arylsulfatase n=1 Tax=Blastopirellula marina TaxID=124 RepID=A0A2S8GFA3_9BACT|nr:arylsulfatase [Blastopirellula marina]PQO43103.1 arylsulfatase [Blastopirellula marina]
MPYRLSVARCASAIVALCVAATQLAAAEPTSTRPNVIILLADDLGYGELQCLNPKRGKIPTPRLDAIAASGMIFTDAHSGSSVCTPTRYGLMTGRYAFRTRLQSGVLTGGESLIAADRLTIAKLLRRQGYDTAIIGKWHLGMLFDGEHRAGAVPVGAQVTHGPIDRGGFDEFHGFHHARQIETWIDDDRVTAEIEPVDMLPRLTKAAVDFVNSRKDQTAPFFLYVPWSSPHSPVVPSPTWQGKSGLNAHADFVMQTDDAFGQVIDALKANGLYENTLVICSADNGTSAPTSNLDQLQSLGHYPSGDLRGSKADIWDGGHRVPFLVSWPAVISAGSQSDSLVCLTDVTATLADLLRVPLPPNAAEDSVSFLPTLKGATTAARPAVIHHSIDGYFAIRDGNWKLACCPGSGGWTKPKPNAAWKLVDQQKLPPLQLYDLQNDLGETNNLAAEMPEKVAELRSQLDRIIAAGRSTPGPDQANDAKINVDKRKPKK